MNSPSIWTAEWNPQEQHLARQLEPMLRVSSLDSCPEEMETVQEGTKATRNRKPESLKEERQSWARERQGQATKSWGRIKVLVALQIVLAWLFHKIEFSCQKWIYFLFFPFFQNCIKFISTGCLSYSILLQADENPSAANDRPLPFPHSSLRSEHTQ